MPPSMAWGQYLPHTMKDGTERPVAYASRTLTAAEKRYSQLEKEGLVIILGTKKFHNYLCGRLLSIESDHQPLDYLFNEAKGISPMASSRIQWCPLTLSAYQYTIRQKAGKSLNNVDALSRLPRSVTTSLDKLPGDLVHLMDHLSVTTVNANAIRLWTSKDPVLSQVSRYIMGGRPDAVSLDLKLHQNRSKEHPEWLASYSGPVWIIGKGAWYRAFQVTCCLGCSKLHACAHIPCIGGTCMPD